jgi:hypothetical protein
MSETMLVIAVMGLFGGLTFVWMRDHHRSEERRAMAVPGDDEGIDPSDLRQRDSWDGLPSAVSNETRVQRPPQGLSRLGMA